MEENVLLGLFFMSLAVGMTPGPNNLILASVGASMGFFGGLRAAAGVILGFPAMIFLVSLGMGSLLLELGWLLWVLKGLGFVLLLWIAWKIANAPPLSVNESGGVEGGRRYYFWEMFVFQWVNPKALAMTTAFASAYTTKLGGGVWWEASVLWMVFSVAAVVSTTSWLFLGSLIRRLLTHKLWSRVYGLLMALLLLVSVIPVLWDGLFV
jgi:threonine/homoserine/homoserine lactone efflux protein